MEMDKQSIACPGSSLASTLYLFGKTEGVALDASGKSIIYVTVIKPGRREQARQLIFNTVNRIISRISQ